MKILSLIFLIVFGFFSLTAQERFVKPIDEAKTDASLLAFRTKLIEAARRRDAKYVLSVLDPNIKNSFGGDGGIEEFKEKWKINDANSEFWNEFTPVINNGGNFFDESDDKLFIAPYSFQAFPDDLDAFNHSVIFGSNVNLRSRADANSKVVEKLSYNIVEILNSVKSKSDSEKDEWYEIKTLGGKTGFVNAAYVRSPIDYRAGFEKKNGKWKMTFFLAGD